MKLLGSILAALGLALVVAGLLLRGLSHSPDPGTLSDPSLVGAGTFLVAFGGALIACVLAIAAWWSGVSRSRSRIQRARPNDDVFVMQSTTSLRQFVSQSLSPQALTTYIVCVVSDNALEVWAEGDLVVSVPADTVTDISLGSAVTSREVPALTVSCTAGVFELVPGRPGRELFPILDRSQVSHLADRILRRLKDMEGHSGSRPEPTQIP